MESATSIVKDMKSASPEVLRQTARDVFIEKIGHELPKDDNGNPIMDLFSEGERVPKVEAREITVGRVLGRGGFCVVRDCTLSMSSSASVGSNSSKGSFFGRLTSSGSVRNNSSSINSLRDNSHIRSMSSSGHRSISSERSSSSVPMRFRRAKGAMKSRYVVKQLTPELKEQDKITYMKGVVDLAMETRFLGALDHPHIIKLEGVSTCDAFSDGYFIILEKMSETLSKKVKGWMDLDRQCKGITGVFTGSKQKIQRLQSERIAAAYDLAIGMKFLHEQNIVFRDLKPDNIGFNYVGLLKIFDFGLAKELKEKDLEKDGLYRNMTRMTGAVRYMSPENARGLPYGLTTDVYSWSMIMWFVLALEPPFAMYTEKMILERVCDRGYRPKVFNAWTPRIAKLISRSWDADPTKRPSFSKIAEELKKELQEVDPRLASMVEQSEELGGVPE